MLCLHIECPTHLVQCLDVKTVHTHTPSQSHAYLTNHLPAIANHRCLAFRQSSPALSCTNQVDDAARECGVRGEYDSGDVDLRSDEGRDWEKDYMDAIRAVGVDAITVRGVVEWEKGE